MLQVSTYTWEPWPNRIKAKRFKRRVFGPICIEGKKSRTGCCSTLEGGAEAGDEIKFVKKESQRLCLWKKNNHEKKKLGEGKSAPYGKQVLTGL